MLWFNKKPEQPKETSADHAGLLKEMSNAMAPTLFNGADYDKMSESFGYYTGSTIPGTMSMPRPWKLDYYALRERSWQAYTENELASAFLDRLRHFVINTGLRMQYEPSNILEDLGINFPDDDRNFIERDFAVYASSPAASLDNKRDLHTLADEAYLNMNAAGDLLVILHIDNGEIKIQHIDGKNLVTPSDRATLLAAATKRNQIIDGVEYDKKGREVAYYVRQDISYVSALTGSMKNPFSFERVPARGPSGRLIAFRPNRNNQRIGGARGKPLLSPVLQNLEITRRYKLAELLAAEVNAQFVMAIEHKEFSSGQNPLQKLPYGGGRHTDGQAQELAGGWSTDSGDKIAGKVTNTTPGLMINLGRGQEIKGVDAKRPNVDGAAFINMMNQDTSAGIGIPHEVAKMLFSTSYSASRAALEMFKIIIQFERKQFTAQYYAPIAIERMRMRALTGKIKMPKQYTNAIITRDETLLSAFETFRFTGVVVPHIDPLKEVNAAIARIGALLSTRERETEALGVGDFEANAKRLKKEKDILDSLGLVATVNGMVEAEEPEEDNDKDGNKKTDDSKE
jgi:capsid protein